MALETQSGMVIAITTEGEEGISPTIRSVSLRTQTRRSARKRRRRKIERLEPAIGEGFMASAAGELDGSHRSRPGLEGISLRHQNVMA